MEHEGRRQGGLLMANPATNRTRHPHRSLSARRQIPRPNHDGPTPQAALAAMRGALEKAGLDLAQFEEMRGQSRAELRKALAGYRAAADERAPAMQGVVNRSGEHWLRGKRVVSALAPADSFYSVGAADMITATSNIDLISQTIAPFANTAQIILDQADGVDALDEALEFLFSWDNPTGQDLMCTLTGVIGVTATAIVTAEGYWWPFTPPPASQIDVFAELDVLVDVLGEITSPPYQSTQAQQAVNLSVEGAFFEEGTIAGQDIFRGYVLQYTDLLVPAGARLDVSLNCEISTVAYHGGCQFVAAGGGREISAFGAFINAEPGPASSVSSAGKRGS
jgi:hypothetical protein